MLAKLFRLLGLKESSPAEHYAVGCETCAALRDTIHRQEETIDLLTNLVSEERAERKALLERFNVIRSSESVSVSEKQAETKQIRRSRIPWSRQQTLLEQQSAREAIEVWRERARQAAEEDARTEVKAQ